MKALIEISIFIISLWMIGCASGKSGLQPAVGSQQSEPVVSANHGAIPARALPKAVIYRTNGDYNNNVPVNLNDLRTALVSYPAPTDISSHSAPVGIGEGWLFDRRGGVGVNTAFLSYTYAEYSALKSVPSQAELLKAVIPGSGVTQCILTPVPLAEAMANPDVLKKYIPR